MNSFFIVTSHGWSASNWLALSLNKTAEIICTHSARNLVAAEKEMNSDENFKKNLRSLHKGYLSRQNRSLGDVYDDICEIGPASYFIWCCSCV